MRQVTLNIPDRELEFFLQLIKKFNYKLLFNKEDGIVISEEDKELVRERRRTAKRSDFISWDDAKKTLKAKYGF